MRLAAAMFAAAVGFAPLTASAALAAIPAAVIADPAPDKAHPADMQYAGVPSHGVVINGVIYLAAGAGPHPTLLLLHGLPGLEQNLDLAQAARRAGWNVLTLHYRGAWGSPGTFSFTSSAEDCLAALAWLRDPAVAAKYRIDAGRIAVAGHSMGGYMTAATLAADKKVLGGALFAPGDIGAMGLQVIASGAPDPRAIGAKALNDNGLQGLNTTAEALADDLLAHAKTENFVAVTPALADRPLLLVTADDGFRGFADGLAERTRKLGNRRVTQIHFADDHAFDAHRVALAGALVDWLNQLVPPARP